MITPAPPLSDPVRLPLGFIAGAGYLLRGLRLLPAPRVRWLVLTPIVITIAIFGLGFVFGYQQLTAYTAGWATYLPAWLMEWVGGIILSLLTFLGALIFMTTFSLVAGMVAAPFCGIISEQVERHLAGDPTPLPKGEGTWRVIKNIPLAWWNELEKLLNYLKWNIPIGILLLIPGLNLAAPGIWLVYTAWMFAVEYVDFPMANHGLPTRHTRRALRRHLATAWGFGGGVMVMFLIPVVNFLTIPAAVAGATLLWSELLAREAAAELAQQAAKIARDYQ